MGSKRKNKMPRASSDIPRKSGIPREVLKWLQSMDLSFPIRNIKRDFSNGFMISEILHWYYPSEIYSYSFEMATSVMKKERNWNLLEAFFTKKKLKIPHECKLDFLPEDQKERTIFNDRPYQKQLPMFARATATLAIKTNLKVSETITENRLENIEKAHGILVQHYDHRCEDRLSHKDRFNIRMTLGQKAVRKAPKNTQDLSEDENGGEYERSASRNKQQREGTQAQQSTTSVNHDVIANLKPKEKCLTVHSPCFSPSNENSNFDVITVVQTEKPQPRTRPSQNIHTLQTPAFSKPKGLL